MLDSTIYTIVAVVLVYIIVCHIGGSNNYVEFPHVCIGY